MAQIHEYLALSASRQAKSLALPLSTRENWWEMTNASSAHRRRQDIPTILAFCRVAERDPTKLVVLTQTGTNNPSSSYAVSKKSLALLRPRSPLLGPYRHHGQVRSQRGFLSLAARRTPCSQLPPRRPSLPGKGSDHGQGYTLQLRRRRPRVATCSMSRAGVIDLDSFGQEPYIKLGECMIVNVPPASGTFVGIIHFLGGVFVSAAPDLSYKLLMQGLAKDGYLVITTPYTATFDHAECTKQVQRKFVNCIDLLASSPVLLPGGISSSDVVPQLPIYGVGHSNGALIHVLMSCLCTGLASPDLNKANVLISFNNKSASEAVPSFDQVGPAVAGLSAMIEASPFADLARSVGNEAGRAAMQAATSAAMSLSPFTRGIQQIDQGFQPLLQLSEQLIPVVKEITDGVSEFTPSPSQNREAISRFYSVKKSLLVKFTVDGLDETPTLEELLRMRARVTNGSVEVRELPGTHITPLAQDITWRYSSTTTPLEALADALRDAAIRDLRLLKDTIVHWLATV
ncbi:hypothetical protein CBR_g30757 [Chara braunii]|uniref:Uncharacterized protein n=1 Tax=Chara braunii TaxID=69332 RepID=A0A388LDK6_CHABU|nr:hypothetical protein CBR_g30757 [Chara braunii]|eukprot:GBG80389.1 hypothetical protein CBR_g30757 [Chara braunii]